MYFCRLLDVQFGNTASDEIGLTLVFEYIDQDLATFLERSSSLGSEKIRVRLNDIKKISLYRYLC